jgi:hypothetical protein
MLPPKKVLWDFLLRFALILAVYLVPWRPIGNAYSSAAAALGNALVEAAPNARVQFHFASSGSVVTETPRESFGVELRAENASAGAFVRIPIDLRTLAYVPTAVFLALAIAAPIWQKSRGLTVLLVGLGALQVFLVFSIAVPLVLFFSNPVPMHLWDLAPRVQWILDVFYRALVAPPGMAFAVPGALWLLLIWLVPVPAEADLSPPV